jgi:hypothetical protein
MRMSVCEEMGTGYLTRTEGLTLEKEEAVSPSTEKPNATCFKEQTRNYSGVRGASLASIVVETG